MYHQSTKTFIIPVNDENCAVDEDIFKDGLCPAIHVGYNADGAIEYTTYQNKRTIYHYIKLGAGKIITDEIKPADICGCIKYNGQLYALNAILERPVTVAYFVYHKCVIYGFGHNGENLRQYVPIMVPEPTQIKWARGILDDIFNYGAAANGDESGSDSENDDIIVEFNDNPNNINNQEQIIKKQYESMCNGHPYFSPREIDEMENKCGSLLFLHSYINFILEENNNWHKFANDFISYFGVVLRYRIGLIANDRKLLKTLCGKLMNHKYVDVMEYNQAICLHSLLINIIGYD